MARFYKSGMAESPVVKDGRGIMEPVQLSSDTTVPGGSSAPYNLFNTVYGHSRNSYFGGAFGTVAQVKANFTTNAVWGPGSRYNIFGLGGEPGLQLPTKAALDASLVAQGFDVSSPVSFEMLLVFGRFNDPIPLLNAADSTVNFVPLTSAPLTAFAHEQWRLRLTKGGGSWSETGNWVVEAVRTMRMPRGMTLSPKYAGTAVALSGTVYLAHPDFYFQVTDASSNLTLPTQAQIEAMLGDLGFDDNDRGFLSWSVRIHNDDGSNALTFAPATGVAADTNSIVSIPANGTGHLCYYYNTAGTSLLYYVI